MNKLKQSANCDFGKFMRICQLENLVKSLFMLSFLFGCSTQKELQKKPEQLITASWLKIPEQYALRDYYDDYLTHPFFDIDQNFGREPVKDKRLINFFVTTFEGSPYKYNLDLYSGRLYKDHEYCDIDDIWEGYKGKVQKPNFNQGIIPRSYNQVNNPQNIIVFSDPRKLEFFKNVPIHYETAKLVGSVILESCESYPCEGGDKWVKSQILIGVNPLDPQYGKINLLSELKSKIDWSYTKAVLTNQDGVHQVGKKYFPAFRISRELNLDESLKYFASNSTFINADDYIKWREGCFKIYDDLWSKTQKIRSEKYRQSDKFLKLFREFYSLNSNEFYNCQKLVRPGTINNDPDRMWFFTFIQAFTNLEKNGFYYNCRMKSWTYNPKVTEGKFYTSQIKELESCKGPDLEKSFDQAINGLSLMKTQGTEQFRFLEYDSERGGTHQKIYGWIKESSRASLCKKTDIAGSENQFDIFPQDVVWANFSNELDSL